MQHSHNSLPTALTAALTPTCHQLPDIQTVVVNTQDDSQHTSTPLSCCWHQDSAMCYLRQAALLLHPALLPPTPAAPAQLSCNWGTRAVPECDRRRGCPLVQAWAHGAHHHYPDQLSWSAMCACVRSPSMLIHVPAIEGRHPRLLLHTHAHCLWPAAASRTPFAAVCTLAPRQALSLGSLHTAAVAAWTPLALSLQHRHLHPGS
jgi:hypothetical protein